MVDYHTHVLPRMDDGSRSVAESIRMLTALKEQGTDTVCLTPHFNGTKETADEFLTRRREAYVRLSSELPAGLPELRLGAEVKYYRGVSRLEGLSRLKLEGTELLLLEMPFSPWGREIVNEVAELQNSGNFKVMLAHVERYLLWEKRGIWERLLKEGVIMQSNAEFFFAPVVRARAVRMLAQGRIHVLGTDTHDLTLRGPRMEWALRTVERSLGADALVRLKAGSDRLLKT